MPFGVPVYSKSNSDKPDVNPNVDKDRVLYAGGWKPTPYTTPSDIELPPHHAIINQYTAIRNTVDFYTFSIRTHVVKPDDITKAEWKAEPETIVTTVEDFDQGRGVCPHLCLRAEGEEFGAMMKMPKFADLSRELVVLKPKKGGFYVTMFKTGSKMQPDQLPKLPDEITGDGPRRLLQNGIPMEGDHMFQKGVPGFDPDCTPREY